MGYYIEVPMPIGKAGQIVDIYGAKHVSPQKPSELPEGQTLVCVVQNGIFDAAGICYDDDEFEAFSDPGDFRTKVWLAMDTQTAREACPKYDDWLKAHA